MDFIVYVLGGLTDLIVLIILLPLLPVIKFIGCEKLYTFVKEICRKILNENGLR